MISATQKIQTKKQKIRYLISVEESDYVRAPQDSFECMVCSIVASRLSLARTAAKWERNRINVLQSHTPHR